MAMYLHTIVEISEQLGFTVQIESAGYILMEDCVELEFGLTYPELIESLLCHASTRLHIVQTDLDMAQVEIALADRSLEYHRNRNGY